MDFPATAMFPLIMFPLARFLSRYLLLPLALIITGCGGNSSSSKPQVDDDSPTITISGKITYDFVPHSLNGLDYTSIQALPGRGVVVELLDENNLVLAGSLTDSEGRYSFSAARNKLVKIRAKAQLLRDQIPTWNFKVTDNTSNNSLYSMTGNLVAATEASTTRNLHASSGWTGGSYTNPRVAAPFAILDSIYVGVERIQNIGTQTNFPALELRWSTKNKAAEGNIAQGEIGTSYFAGDSIYILGDENNDTDEYDRHVILHEWGHYIEAYFSRSDSIGGDHAHDDKLDMRVAMSEGFANAFSAIMLDDPGYRDSSGRSQTDNFHYDVSRKNNNVRGWYSEASVQSAIYNFYVSGNGKRSRDFADIFRIINASDYIESNPMISIYVFAEQLRRNLPEQAAQFNSLLSEQNIEITDEYGAGESNSGGHVGSLPVYKNLSIANVPVNICSTNRFGFYNKLAAAHYFVVDIATQGNYQFSALESSGVFGVTDPDLYLYQRGKLIDFAEGPAVGQERLSRLLTAGTYILEVVDARVRDPYGATQVTGCFDVRAQLLN